MPVPHRILGLDPGLEHTGWGIIESLGNQLTYIASGAIHTKPADPVPTRLCMLAEGLLHVLQTHRPQTAAVEEVIVNVNARTSLKLGQARGVCLLLPQQQGAPVSEYAARLVKKSLVGTGAAEKEQVAHMVKLLLPRCQPKSLDESDALAVAITHAHHLSYARLTAA